MSLTVNAPPSAAELRELDRALVPWFTELDSLLEADGPLPGWLQEAGAPNLLDPDPRLLALIHAHSVSAAVYSGDGQLIEATPSFAAARAAELVDRIKIRSAARGRGEVLAIDEPGEAPRTGLIAYAPGKATISWRIPEPLHVAAGAGSDRVVVVTTVVDDRLRPIETACRAYGLTGLQTRVALETVRQGNIRAAAAALSLSYQTARESLAEALKKIGALRLPGLVTRVTTLAFGVFPGRAASADFLADIWGLTERQIAVAGLVAEGLSRDQAAKTLGVSSAVLKKELESIFELLQVNSGAALARRLAEARALGWLTETTAGGMGFVDDTLEPLRILVDESGRQIAFSDYGPASGKAVLVVHSSMTSRIVSRKLLRSLHRAGFRPISIDRPGFGLSDPMPASAGDDPFVAGTTDVRRVLDYLRIRSVDLVSRGGAQFVTALAKAMPDRLNRVVVVNPGPPYRQSGRGLGPLAVIKDAFVRNPATVRAIANFLAGQLTYRRVAGMLAQWMRGSLPDERAVQDPEFINDFYRSVRMFATGRFEGFVREQVAISRTGAPEPLQAAASWTVFLGDNDVLYDPDVVFDYWRALWPGARFTRVPEGGRFLAMTHADMVASALASPG